jgi:hypothetical protein
MTVLSDVSIIIKYLTQHISLKKIKISCIIHKILDSVSISCGYPCFKYYKRKMSWLIRKSILA